MADTTQNETTQLFNEASFDERIQLAEASFRTVLEADLHEDDKAGRILSAMAFLTAAAAGIFTIAYSPGPSAAALKQSLTQTLSPYVSAAKLPTAVDSAMQSLQKPPLTLFSLNVPVLAFSLYIFFILVGAALYLGALGPSLNRPSWFRTRDQHVHSLLFFQNIGALDAKVWSGYWKDNTLGGLQNQLLENYIYECQLIAQKVDAKVTLMSWGSLFFRIAVLCLAVLIATLFSSDLGLVGLFLLLGLFGISASFLFVNLVLPPQKLQLPPQKSGWQAASLAIIDLMKPKSDDQKGDERNKYWQTRVLVITTILSLIGFLILLAIKL